MNHDPVFRQIRLLVWLSYGLIAIANLTVIITVVLKS